VNGWLVDTNVLSAFAPRRPPLSVRQAQWFRERADALFLSTITIMEIVAGIARLRRSGAERRAEQLQAWLDRTLDLYRDRILVFDLAAAPVAGALSDAARALGRHPGFADIAIAAIARSRALVLLTANLRDFAPLGVDVLDPLAAN